MPLPAVHWSSCDHSACALCGLYGVSVCHCRHTGAADAERTNDSENTAEGGHTKQRKTEQEKATTCSALVEM